MKQGRDTLQNLEPQERLNSSVKLIFLFNREVMQPSEFTAAYGNAAVNAVVVRIYGGKIMPP